MRAKRQVKEERRFPRCVSKGRALGCLRTALSLAASELAPQEAQFAEVTREKRLAPFKTLSFAGSRRQREHAS